MMHEDTEKFFGCLFYLGILAVAGIGIGIGWLIFR